MGSVFFFWSPYTLPITILCTAPECGMHLYSYFPKSSKLWDFLYIHSKCERYLYL